MKIGVIPGDGIGPEVVAQAMRVVEEVARIEGFSFDTSVFDLGAGRFLRDGMLIDDGTISDIASCDAVLLGAVGDPRVAPGVVEVGLLLRLRQELDLYVNLRPARLFEGVATSLADRHPQDLDFLVVRENSEGLYSRLGESSGGVSTEVSVNTDFKVERIIRFAFEQAAELGRSLTLVHKVNVLERAGKLYSDTFARVGAEFPGVETSYQHVDAAALLLVTDPARFEVVVTDNLFGDILSDLTAGLVGGIGLVGSGNIHPGKVSIFEPVHGSAPDIAGTGKANPIGAILSSAMMLAHVGQPFAAERIHGAVAMTAAKSPGLTTEQIADLVGEAL